MSDVEKIPNDTPQANLATVENIPPDEPLISQQTLVNGDERPEPIQTWVVGESAYRSVVRRNTPTSRWALVTLDEQGNIDGEPVIPCRLN